MNLIDQRGKSILLGPQLGKGGEAAIYAVRGRTTLVAKIYHAHNAARTDKLRAMVDHPPADPTQRRGHVSICWPESMLFNEAKLCVGFLMPLLDRSKHRELFQLYNPMDRRQQAPNFTWAYLLKAAENIAIVMESIHSRGYVVGDVNESNFFVSDQALVTLVDCDSMQVRTPTTVFRCTVAKPEYLAPELQGRDLALTDRTPEQDNFALAVLLFLLLMEGVHPFNGAWIGAGDAPPLEKRIAGGDCPYAGAPRIRPMPSAPPFDLLPAALRSLFVRAFGQGHTHPSARPSAREWREALADVELSTCAANKQHTYPMHLLSCPWCERAVLLRGFDPFPRPESLPAQKPLQARPFTPVAPQPPAPPRPAPQRASYAPPRQPLFRFNLGASASLPPLPRYSIATPSRKVRAVIFLVPIISALLSVGFFMAFSYRQQVFSYWLSWLLAGALGFVVHSARRRQARSLLSAAIGLGALYQLLYSPRFGDFDWEIPILAGWAALLGTRSYLLLARRSLENAAMRGRLASSALRAAAVAIAFPPLCTLALTAQRPPMFFRSARSVLSMPAPASAQVLTCARIEGECGCQVQSAFRPGNAFFIVVNSPVEPAPAYGLTLTLPHGSPQPVALQRHRAPLRDGSCAVARTRIPPGTPAGFAGLHLSGAASALPSLDDHFLIVR